MFDNKEKTEIEKLGEFGLIDYLTKENTLKQKGSLKGVGDDAAVLDFTGKKVLVSTDMLLEGIHFDLAYTPLKHLGYKAIQVNLSDIYAMNGTPTQVTVSIGMSSKFPLEAIEELYQGIYLACEKYNVDLVGGDTTSSKQGLVISVTVLPKRRRGRRFDLCIWRFGWRLYRFAIIGARKIGLSGKPQHTT